MFVSTGGIFHKRNAAECVMSDVYLPGLVGKEGISMSIHISFAMLGYYFSQMAIPIPTHEKIKYNSLENACF